MLVALSFKGKYASALGSPCWATRYCFIVLAALTILPTAGRGIWNRSAGASRADNDDGAVEEWRTCARRCDELRLVCGLCRPDHALVNRGKGMCVYLLLQDIVQSCTRGEGIVVFFFADMTLEFSSPASELTPIYFNLKTSARVYGTPAPGPHPPFGLWSLV